MSLENEKKLMCAGCVAENVGKFKKCIFFPFFLFVKEKMCETVKA